MKRIVCLFLAFGLWGAIGCFAEEQARPSPSRPVQAAAPPDPAKVAEERKLADSLYDFGKTEEAKVIYLRIASSLADDFEFNKRLANCFYLSPKKEMDKAARYYARAYELNPKDRGVELALGQAYSWSRQYKAAIPVFRRILARDPSNNDAWVELARAESLAGQIEAARATYQSYVERRPADREMRLEFAAFLSRNRQPEAALEQYRYVLRANPWNLKARLGEAQVLAWQGNLKEGLRHYDDILHEVPDNEDALRGKAFVLLRLQRYEEAGKIFAQVIKKKPADRDVQEALQQIAEWKAEEPRRAAEAAAEAAAAKDDYPEAIALLRQAIARAPQNDRLRFRLGEFYLRNGQAAEAIETFQKLYAERPENLAALRALGNAQLRTSRLDDAVATFRAYLQRSADPAVEVSLAHVLRWSGKHEQATSLYRQVLQGDPNNLDASWGLGYALAGQGQYQQALEKFDAILRQQPGNRDALLGKAQVLHWSGEPDKALAVLEPMQETWPQDREIAGVLQSVRDAERQRVLQAEARPAPVDIDERIRMYQETLARDPKNPSVLQRLGELYQAKKDYPRAITYFEQALAQRPDDTALRLAMARLASWNSDYARSIILYQALLAQDPDNREYRFQVAKLLSWSGRKPESIEQYRQILKRNPNDLEARLGLAQVLSWNGDYPGSISLYQGLLAQDPENHEYRMDLAKILSWSGRKPESIQQYRQMLKRNPNDLEARLRLAQVLTWNSDYPEALKLYDDLLIRMPTDRDARLGKAQALQWSGRAREAKEILEELQAKDPKDRDVGIALASVQSALGRRDLALRQLDYLDKLQPGNSEVEQMRRSIRQDLRSVLILRFEPLVDSDELTIYQSSATVYFNIVPQVRSYVSAGIIPSREPGLGWETGRKTVFGSSGRVTDWLLMRGEIGANSSTAGHADPIGSGGVTFFPGSKVQFDFDVSRSFINYITRPLLLNISRVELSGSSDWRPDKRTTFHIDYYHQRYSDTNRNNGGTFRVTRSLVRRERLELEAGYRYRAFGFSKNIRNGFWAPSFYQEHMGLANLRGKLTPRMGWSFRGLLGWQQSGGHGEPLDPFQLGGTVQAAWDYSLSDRLNLTLGYAYSASSSLRIAGGGVSSGYTANLGYVTLEYRF